MKALIINNKPAIISMFQRIIDKTAGELLQVSNCIEAKSCIDKHGMPELLIIDVDDCGQDGMELMKQTRNDFGRCSTSILAIVPDNTKKIYFALSLGADEILVKPLNLVSLSIKIKKMSDKFIYSA